MSKVLRVRIKCCVTCPIDWPPSIPSGCGLALPDTFSFRQQVLGKNLQVINQIKKANHHFIPALLPPDDGFRRVWILRIVSRVVEMGGALNASPWRQVDGLCEVVPELPMPVVLRDAQDCSCLATREHHPIFEIFASGMHVRMNGGQRYWLADLKGSIDTIVWIARWNLEGAIRCRQSL